MGFDRCHVKGATPKQILIVIGIDPNIQIFLMTYVVVETKCKDNWNYLLIFSSMI